MNIFPSSYLAHKTNFKKLVVSVICLINLTFLTQAYLLVHSIVYMDYWMCATDMFNLAIHASILNHNSTSQCIYQDNEILFEIYLE